MIVPTVVDSVRLLLFSPLWLSMLAQCVKSTLPPDGRDRTELLSSVTGPLIRTLPPAESIASVPLPALKTIPPVISSLSAVPWPRSIAAGRVNGLMACRPPSLFEDHRCRRRRSQ